jgi:hypothetical protein
MKKLLGMALVGLLATTTIGCGPKAGASGGGGTKVAPPADGTAPPAGAAGTTTPADPSTSPAATPAPPG